MHSEQICVGLTVKMASKITKKGIHVEVVLRRTSLDHTILGTELIKHHFQTVPPSSD